MSEVEKPLSPLEAKISQAYRVNEAVEDICRDGWKSKKFNPNGF